MTRMTARLSALMAAFSITIVACSENNPVAPQFTGPNATSTVGVVTYFNDPSIVDILVSSCDAELPASGERITPWQHNDMMNSFELEIGCYDIRVLRITNGSHSSFFTHICTRTPDRRLKKPIMK